MKKKKSFYPPLLNLKIFNNAVKPTIFVLWRYPVVKYLLVWLVSQTSEVAFWVANKDFLVRPRFE